VRILVTNDDGVESEGLAALARALAAVGDVFVVAPASNQTAVARAITLTPTIAVDEVELGDGRTAFAVAGTPCDCVRFAVLGVAGERPDIVVSGINRGANLGDDVAYSGTVAAAFEGLLQGLPSIALSQQAVDGNDWDPGATFEFEALAALAARLVQLVAERGLPSGTLLNVNGPATQHKGVKVAPLGRRMFSASLKVTRDAEGRGHYSPYGVMPGYHDDPDSDVTAIDNGYVTVTPLHFDITDRVAVEHLASWPLAGLVTP
jgi:5'-nucleotidase